MFKRIKSIFRREPRDIVVVKKSAMTKEQARLLGDATGKVVVLVDNIEDVTIAGKEPQIEGDGNAAFFGEPTENEELDHQRELDGSLPWYKRILS